MQTKVCIECDNQKELSEFYKQSSLPGRYKHICKICTNKRTRKWRLAHPKQWNQKGRDYRLRCRQKALEVYGNQCKCCGEKRKEFLAIDHTAGGGTRHRKEISSDIYTWLKQQNYPVGFQILCHNCNMSLGFYDYCPHQLEDIT